MATNEKLMALLEKLAKDNPAALAELEKTAAGKVADLSIGDLVEAIKGIANLDKLLIATGPVSITLKWDTDTNALVGTCKRADVVNITRGGITGKRGRFTEQDLIAVCKAIASGKTQAEATALVGMSVPTFQIAVRKSGKTSREYVAAMAAKAAEPAVAPVEAPAATVPPAPDPKVPTTSGKGRK